MQKSYRGSSPAGPDWAAGLVARLRSVNAAGIPAGGRPVRGRRPARKWRSGHSDSARVIRGPLTAPDHAGVE
jgi:hypothetical protein